MIDEARECDWDERLQDWIDGDLDRAEAAAVGQHAAGCAVCRERLGLLRAVDAQLSVSLPPQALSAAFDRGVLERIAVITAADRAAARARLETERRDQLAALNRGWRRLRRSIVLTAVGWTSVVIALATSLRPGAEQAALLDRIASLTHLPGASLAAAVLGAAVATLAGLVAVRVLAAREGG